MILPVFVYASGFIMANVLYLLLSNFWRVNRSPYSTSFSCLAKTTMTDPRNNWSRVTPGQAILFKNTFLFFRSYCKA